MQRSAAIVTVGSELTLGLRVDTNTAEVARALTPRGFRVAEAVSISDDVRLLSDTLRRLCAEHELVIVTGGLGPTHDDITRHAASAALGLPLVRDARLEALLQPAVTRHTDPAAGAQVLVQADVLEGAEVIDPTTGTAPGLVIPTPAGLLALLPGPPFEMRPMLAHALERFPMLVAQPRELGVAQTSESDVQVIVQRALGEPAGVGFTVLAKPGDVRVILSDEGAGAEMLERTAVVVAEALGPRCYARDGATLAEVVVREAAARGRTVSFAESCTGGMICAAVTDVPGSSAVLLGGIVTYSDDAKRQLLDVSREALEERGAVSEQVASAMAAGARRRFGSDYAISVTGIAGPDGGSDDKPVGTVWFGVEGPGITTCFVRRFPGGTRAAVRDRATATALDTLRRAVCGLPSK